jgi:hypothetical protein
LGTIAFSKLTDFTELSSNAVVYCRCRSRVDVIVRTVGALSARSRTIHAETPIRATEQVCVAIT